MNNNMPPPRGTTPVDIITNGSFQVWQRGGNVSGNTLQIGPDMWSGNGNISRTYTKSADGCAVTANQSGTFMGISQKIEWCKALNDMAMAAGCLTLIYEYAANRPCFDYQGNRCTQAYVWYTALAVAPFTAADGETALANGYYNLADRIGINCLLNGDPLPVGFSFTVKYVRCLIGAYTLDSAPPYVPSDPDVELYKAQKYLAVFGGALSCNIGACRAVNATICVGIIALPRDIRSQTPTIVPPGAWDISDGNTATPIVGLNSSRCMGNAMQVVITTSGLTPGSIYTIRIPNNGKLIISAEL